METNDPQTGHHHPSPALYWNPSRREALERRLETFLVVNLDFPKLPLMQLQCWVMVATYLFSFYFGAAEPPKQAVLFCRKKLTPRFYHIFWSTSDQNSGVPAREERRNEQFTSEEWSKQVTAGSVVLPTAPS